MQQVKDLGAMDQLRRNVAPGIVTASTCSGILSHDMSLACALKPLEREMSSDIDMEIYSANDCSLLVRNTLRSFESGVRPKHIFTDVLALHSASTLKAELHDQTTYPYE